MPKPSTPTLTLNPTSYTPGRLKLITVMGQGFPNIKRVNIYAVRANDGGEFFWGWAQPVKGGLVVTEELILPEGHPSETWEIQATDVDGNVLATASLTIG